MCQQHRWRGAADKSCRRALGVTLLLLLSTGCASSPSGTDSATSTTAPPARASAPPSATGPTFVLGGHLFYTMDGVIHEWDRAGDRRLTGANAYCCVLRVSPITRRLMVMPGTDAVGAVSGGTLSPTGGDYLPLPTDGGLNLVPQAWSPDGERIAMEGWDPADDAQTGIYTSNAVHDSAPMRVTARPGRQHDVPLDYSPDGTQIVFYRSAHVDPDPQVGGSLWVVKLDGSALRRIVAPSSMPAAWARWSPDGSAILFAGQRTAAAGFLRSVRPDGSGLKTLFNGSATRFPIQPVWSPDGSRVLFCMDPNNDQFSHPDNALFAMNRDGSELKVVLDPQGYASMPEWTP